MTNTPNTPPDGSLVAPAAAEQAGLPSIDLEQLSPNDVVAIYRDLERREDAHMRTRRAGGTDDYSERFEPYLEAMRRGIEHLPERNPEHARDICATLADSPLAGDRAGADIFIYFLTKASPEHGLPLWERLLRDPDPNIRASAYNLIDDLLGSDRESADESVRELGVSWCDIAMLLNAYIKAEKGSMLAKPGELIGDLMMRRAGILPPEDAAS